MKLDMEAMGRNRWKTLAEKIVLQRQTRKKRDRWRLRK